jgi:signal transduction histidine kinase
MRTDHRRLTRGFVAAATVALVIPAVTVAWLGWLLVRSDRELDRQRVQERLDVATSLLVSNLERAVSSTEQRLATAAAAMGQPRQHTAGGFQLAPADGAIVVFERGDCWSSTSLAWYPGDAPVLADEHEFHFLDGETLEFRGDLDGAARTYQAASRAADRQLRAGALARLARVQRKRGQPTAALASYDSLARLIDTAPLGRPADLLASLERLELLEDLHDHSRLKQEALELTAQLVAGRWRLMRSQFDFYTRRVTELARAGRADATVLDEGVRRPGSKAASVPALAIAEAVSSAAEAVAAAGPSMARGHQAWSNAHGRGLIVWRRVGDRAAALVATRAWVDRAWLDDVRRIAHGQRARVALSTADGAEWIDESIEGPTVRRGAGDTGLPFTVRVSSADPAGESSTFARRRRLLVGIVGALALLMIGSGYIAARGVGREVAAARLQSEFVAAVSHEFRTPVASVRQLSEMLEEGRVADEGKRLEYYGRIRRQAGRLQRLVENLLDFGRMEAEAAGYRAEHLDAADLVRNVTQEFQGEGRGTGRTLSVIVREPLPLLVGDREALGRALWNLLDNAAKYSPAEALIHVHASAEDGAVTIQVRDEGPGIAHEEHARIFDKFVRGAIAQESGTRGTGLGLAMVRHIVRAHGGDVLLDSAPGKGSTFTLRLKLPPQVRPDVAPQVGPGVPPQVGPGVPPGR